MRRSRARTGAAAAYDPTLGAIVMFGGYGTAGALNDTWLWRNGAWAALPFQTGPSARGGAGLAWDGSELLLFGGDTELGSDKVLADTWRLVGATWEPAQPAVSPPARTVGHGMAYDGTEVVMFGGWNPNAGTGYGGTFDDTWVYQSATSTWRELTPSPHPSARRAVLAEQSDGSGLLLVGGGGSFQMSDTWTFNAGRWQQLAPNCAGGICSFTSNGGVTFPDRNDDVLYDADVTRTRVWRSGQWLAAEDAHTPAPRIGAAAAFDTADGTAVLFGGQNMNGTLLADTFVWTGPAVTSAPQPLIPSASPSNSSPAPSRQRREPSTLPTEPPSQQPYPPSMLNSGVIRSRATTPPTAGQHLMSPQFKGARTRRDPIPAPLFVAAIALLLVNVGMLHRARNAGRQSGGRSARDPHHLR